METKPVKLTKWTFEAELLKIPAKTKKLSNKTARGKVQEVFDKYKFLMSYDKEDINNKEKELQDLKNICNALKTGVVKHKNGFFKISEILSVKKEENKIIVFFKNDTHKIFDIYFEWILDLY